MMTQKELCIKPYGFLVTLCAGMYPLIPFAPTCTQKFPSASALLTCALFTSASLCFTPTCSPISSSLHFTFYVNILINMHNILNILMVLLANFTTGLIFVRQSKQRVQPIALMCSFGQTQGCYNYWLLIELPYWFRACFMVGILGIFDHAIPNRYFMQGEILTL